MTYKQTVKEFVAEVVDGFREELLATERDRENEKIGEAAADKMLALYKHFLKENGKEAHYALYQEPYVIQTGLSRIGIKEVQIINTRTGLELASAGTEAVALQRFNKIAQQKRTGREPEMAGGKKVNTYLDVESVETAKRLGNGNLSEGIRKALKKAVE